MKNIVDTLNPQYIIDSSGKKTAVIMDIATFEELIETLEELYLGAAAEHILATDEEFHDFDKIKKDLIK